MPKLTGTITRQDGTSAAKAVVRIHRNRWTSDGQIVSAPATDRLTLDDDGKFEVELQSTDGVQPEGTSYTVRVEERSGAVQEWTFPLTEDADLSDFPANTVAPDPVVVVTGETGDAATVDVESTVTLPAGEDAEVTNVGDVNHAMLRFSIPKGDQGEKGDPGEVTPADLAWERIATITGDPVEFTGLDDYRVLHLIGRNIRRTTGAAVIVDTRHVSLTLNGAASGTPYRRIRQRLVQAGPDGAQSDLGSLWEAVDAVPVAYCPDSAGGARRQTAFDLRLVNHPDLGVTAQFVSWSWTVTAGTGPGTDDRRRARIETAMFAFTGAGPVSTLQLFGNVSSMAGTYELRGSK